MLICYVGNGKPNNAAVSATHPTVHAALSSLLVIMTGLVGEKERSGGIVGMPLAQVDAMGDGFVNRALL